MPSALTDRGILGGDCPRIEAEQVITGAKNGIDENELVLEIDIRQCLSVVVADDKAGVQFLDMSRLAESLQRLASLAVSAERLCVRAQKRGPIRARFCNRVCGNRGRRKLRVLGERTCDPGTAGRDDHSCYKKLAYVRAIKSMSPPACQQRLSLC